MNDSPVKIKTLASQMDESTVEILLMIQLQLDKNDDPRFELVDSTKLAWWVAPRA